MTIKVKSKKQQITEVVAEFQKEYDILNDHQKLYSVQLLVDAGKLSLFLSHGFKMMGSYWVR